ncbi:MAG: hypothetical protein GY854_19775 [Deltaproteobacteria bacterium]|nr:hypothetical protein [Deltaproteobacteria bacterium]
MRSRQSNPIPTYELDIKDPTDPAHYYAAQANFLSADRSTTETTWLHFVGGRGSGKTSIGVVESIMSSLIWNPGLPGLWTSQTYRHCQDVFLREFQRIVPSKLYTWRKSDGVIEWFNGSTIDVRSRNVDVPSREMNKGGNYAWAGEDELAYKFDRDKWEDVDLAVRHPKAKYRYHSGYTTPKLNDYYDLVREPGHTMIHAQTKDSPFLSPGVYKRLYESMSPKRRAQELEGRFVALEGLVFDNWSDELYPAGNIHPHEHDENLPYYLAFDLGVATSAWAIIQRVGDVFVQTAEFTPRRSDASIDATLVRIKETYGNPIRVVAGADLGTRESGSGRKNSWYVHRHFGAIPMNAVSGWIADKTIQHNQLSMAICDIKDHRTFCVSRNMVSHDAADRRGTLEVMRQDTWPEMKKGVRAAEFLAKEGKLEHMRDALLYFFVAVGNPPDFSLHQNYAA